MRYAFALIAVVAMNTALATAPIQVEAITPDNYRALGFDIEVRREGEAVTVRMKGPAKLNGDCVPRRSGTSLLDSAGEELAMYIAYYESKTSQPSAIAMYTDKTHTMGIFIDYMCPGARTRESRRYMVQSIATFLTEK